MFAHGNAAIFIYTMNKNILFAHSKTKMALLLALYYKNIFFTHSKLQIAADPGCELPPIIQQPLTSITVQAGSTVTFTCRICGRPRPTLSWHFQDNTPIPVNRQAVLMYTDDGMATLEVGIA